MKKKKKEKQTYAPEILDAFFFLRNELKDSPPSFLVPVPTPFQIAQVFLSGSTVCLEETPGGRPYSPLRLHVVYIPLNTLWFDSFPLQITLIAASEALHGLLALSKASLFSLQLTPPTLQATSQPCLYTWMYN